MNGQSGTGFFPGLIVGAVVGAIVALLYAPRTGTETRRLVKEKALQIKEKATKAACGLNESAGSLGSPQG